MDQIPLKWSGVPEFKKIIEIANIAFGPYGVNNRSQDLDTVQAFKKITEVARDGL